MRAWEGVSGGEGATMGWGGKKVVTDIQDLDLANQFVRRSSNWCREYVWRIIGAIRHGRVAFRFDERLIGLNDRGISCKRGTSWYASKNLQSIFKRLELDSEQPEIWHIRRDL